MTKHPKLLFLSLLAVYVLSLSYIDRCVLKANKGFCVWELYSQEKPKGQWDEKNNSYLSSDEIADIFNQPLCYLGRGHQSVAFLTKKGDYVVKFYRFPVHMRPMGFVAQPLSSFKQQRRSIEEYDKRKFTQTIESHKLAFKELKEEGALVLTHLNKTKDTSYRAHLIDPLGKKYVVDLMDTIFIVQKKGELLFPRLKVLIEQKQEALAQKIIKNTVLFLQERSAKGYLDKDAMLSKNYGLIADELFQLDTGRLEKADHKLSAEEIKKEVVEITESLKYWLLDKSPELYSYFSEIINTL